MSSEEIIMKMLEHANMNWVVSFGVKDYKFHYKSCNFANDEAIHIRSLVYLEKGWADNKVRIILYKQQDRISVIEHSDRQAKERCDFNILTDMCMTGIFPNYDRFIEMNRNGDFGHQTQNVSWFQTTKELLQEKYKAEDPHLAQARINMSKIYGQ